MEFALPDDDSFDSKTSNFQDLSFRMYNVIIVLSCQPGKMATFFPAYSFYSFSTAFALYYIDPQTKLGLELASQIYQ